MPRPAVSSRAAALSLTLLLLINLFNYIDRYILAAVEPLIAKDLLAPGDAHAQAKMGLLATAFMVSYMLTAPLFGYLGDRLNRWTIIAIGVALWTLASGASGLSHLASTALLIPALGWTTAFTILFLTRCFVGIGEGAYGPTAPALISDLYSLKHRGAVLSLFYIAIPVGSALGYVLGGIIAHRWNWPTAFYAVIPPGLLLAGWCLFRQEPRTPQPSSTGVPPVCQSGAQENAPGPRAPASNYLSLLKNPSYVYNVLGQTAMTFAIGGVSFWMPRYISEFRKAATLETTNTYFGAIVVLAGITATLAGGYLGDKLRPRFPGSYFLVSGVAMLLGFPLFLAVMFTPFPAGWFVIAAAVFCLFFNTGPSNTIIANVVPASVRASAYALCILAIHLFGDAVSPFLIGAATDASNGNMNVGFSLVSGMILLAAIFWLMGTKHLAKDTAAAEHANQSS